MVDLKALSAGLAQREATVPALRPNCAKEIVWAREEGEKTDWAVVFIHGFSASKHEIRPVPDLVAKDLGANLFLARLSGHGQDSDAMGQANLQDWQVDTAEAFGIGHQIGRKLLVIGCSTGCTLSALHLANGGRANGLVQVSPNYGLRVKAAQKLLEWPGLHPLHAMTIGRDLISKPKSAEHAAYWTLNYPLAAASVMAEVVKLADEARLSDIETPTLFAVNPGDMVISPPAAEATAARWGGPVTYHKIKAGPDDDPIGHVMAGDVFSPKQTDPLVRRILDWVTDF